ncbi:GntR family transcriptional regulator [Polynucleobacter sp. AP-Titi-500A-B4]|jgi:GntR family transcriptional regulator|uniref:GntR family transcriptional regulator n=1 Tax=Polynucleobacter sp. AP-Titi-500A-B4 TaxID=2576923 RepID=UPI001BFE63BB|nr:GntR family transcriptional regulator [Polynucleobacter sp. AP-Titi-500A-B4]QWE13000.1 GntR family transcriptional regulator [Polynucleobacter sp. AP-Titi-500A-B4]
MKSLTAYQEVKQKITEDLVRGRYPMGQALPAEKDLSKELDVSIGTLRKAVDELVAEGIVVRRQGRGTYVAEHDLKRLLYYFFHVVKHDADKKVNPRVELVSLTSAVANKEEASKLEIKEGAAVWRLVNCLYLDDKCVMIDQITLDKKRFQKLNRADYINREGSIYQLYQMKYGQTVVRSSERLRAGLAGKQFSEWLGVKPDSPVLIIRRVALGIQDEPLEWRVSTLNTNQHEYFSELVV